MNITKQKSPNFNRGRQGHVPDMIVCHITEGGFDGAVSWLANPVSRVSAHFVVAQDGRITQMVEIADTAWANGTNNDRNSNLWNGFSTLKAVRERAVNANLYTISIEHEGRFAETNGVLTPEQLDATTWLVAHIREEVQRLYGEELPPARQHIVGHNEITPRSRPNCPGADFPFDEIIRRLSEDESEPEVSPPSTSNEPSRWAKEAWEWAVSVGLTDGTNPRSPATREQVMQLFYNYHHRVHHLHKV